MQRRDAIATALGLAFTAEAAIALTPPKSAAKSQITELERAAGIAGVDSAFPPGDVRRYGGAGDGVADDSPAWRAAVATGHGVRGGGPELVYRLASTVVITRATVIDLQGATVKPSGKTQAFLRTPPAPTAQGDAAEGTRRGSTSVKVTDAGGFRAGQWLRLSLDDHPRHDPFSYPPNWTRIAAINGNTLELDTPLQIDYGDGHPKVLAYDPVAIYKRFECANGVFDGSECTHDRDTGQALRIGGVENVVVSNCEFRYFANPAELTCPVEIFIGIDASITGCRFVDGVSNYHVCDIQDVRSARFTDNVIDGSHFGCNITRADAGLFAHNTLQGRRTREANERLPKVRSARGLKAWGCGAIRIIANHASDYESPIKVDACFRYDISHNVVTNAGLSPFQGQIALNVGSQAPGTNMRGGTIMGNLVENCGGIGIGVTSDDVGGVIISNNTVRATQATGIHVGVRNAVVSCNRVEDWGLRGSNEPGIRFSAGASLLDNRFANGASRSNPCMAPHAAGDSYRVLRDNISETGNPVT